MLVNSCCFTADRHVVDFSDVSDTELSAASQAVEDSHICCRPQGVLAADDRALTRSVNARSSAAKTAYKRVFNEICCTVHGLNSYVVSLTSPFSTNMAISETNHGLKKARHRAVM